MSTLFLRATWLSIATLLWVATSSFAGMSSRALDITEQIRDSGMVIVGQAKSIQSRWETNPYGDKLIISQIELGVEETLKGTPGNSVLMDLEGGTIGTLTLEVSDLPKIKTGDRAVFFLDKKDAQTHIPHLRGFGILKLDTSDRVEGMPLNLNEIRTKALQ